MPTITLSNIELDTIQIISNLRQIVNQCCSVKDVKRSTNTSSEINFEGVVGEYAFCKYYNLFLDITPSPRSGGYDCVYEDKRVDIKTTHYKNGRLICTMKENNQVDIYVLAILEKNLVTLVGWAYKDELIDSRNIQDLGYGNTYVLDQNKLRTMF